MDRNLIDEIYLSFINSQEFERTAHKPDYDLSWLEQQISYDDLLKLEMMISKYGISNSKFMFQQGFFYAWELFQQLSSTGRSSNE